MMALVSQCLSLCLKQWKLAAGAAAVAVVLALFGLWRLEVGHARALQAQLAAAQAGQRGAHAQAAAASDAEAVVAEGAARDDRTHDIHEENSHAITAASGSAQGLDPDLNAAGRRGLCGYAVYSDEPACVQLRGDGSGQRPQAGGGDGPAAP